MAFKLIVDRHDHSRPNIVPVYDRSNLIKSAIETLKHTLLEESLIVALVCIVFLLHIRSALVAILMLPVGILMAFGAMRLLGLGANIMSLGGIAIAIGAMIDGAIVMWRALRSFPRRPSKARFPPKCDVPAAIRNVRFTVDSSRPQCVDSRRRSNVSNAQIAAIARRATELARGRLRQRLAFQSICTLGSTEGLRSKSTKPPHPGTENLISSAEQKVPSLADQARGHG
jgi:hypothetical protein